MRSLTLLLVVLVCMTGMAEEDSKPVTVIYFDDFSIEDGGDVFTYPEDGSEPTRSFPPGTVLELANGARYFLFKKRAFPNFVGSASEGWNLIRKPGADNYLPDAIALPRPPTANP